MKHRMRQIAVVAALGWAVVSWRVGLAPDRRAPLSDGRESSPSILLAGGRSPAPVAQPGRASLAGAVRGAPTPVSRPENTPVDDWFARFSRVDSPKLSSTAFDALHRAEVGDPISVDVPGTGLRGRVDSVLRLDGVRHYGVFLDEGVGRLLVALRDDGAVLAPIFFFGESRAFLIQGEAADEWSMEATTVSDIYCALPGQVYPSLDRIGIEKDPSPPPPPKAGARAKAGSGPPRLNSRPSARFVIYCDFDGEVVQHPFWNFGQPIDAQPAPRADDVDYVTAVWKRASEDYFPFDINVTTDRAVFDATPFGRRVHAVITPTSTAAPGSGGVAIIFSFRFGIPCWTFNLSEFTAADTISHEVGHTLGLFHDGRLLPIFEWDEYYGGHGEGEVGWAPIMGAAWSDDDGPRVYNAVTQWSRGEYAYANNRWQDDLAFISSFFNGFGYRWDDVGDGVFGARNLRLNGSGIEDAGVIERNRDQDWFRFTTSGGPFSIHAEPLDVESTDTGGGSDTAGANLAIQLTLYNGFGFPMESAARVSGLDAEINRTLPAGTFFVGVEGVGRGAADFGFSDYASLGQYTLSGSIGAAVSRAGIAVRGGPKLQALIPHGAETPTIDCGTDFGPAAIGAAGVDRTFLVENSGAAPLALGAVAVDSMHFRVLPPIPATIAPGTFEVVMVRFAPSAAGIHQAALTIPSNDPDRGRYVLLLEGEGTDAFLDDAYEENDAMEEAFDWGSGEGQWLSEQEGMAILADDDWYRIVVSQGFPEVRIEGRFHAPEVGLGIALHASDGTVLASSAGTSAPEVLVHQVDDLGGAFYIRVSGAAAGHGYDLLWDDFEPAR